MTLSLKDFGFDYVAYFNGAYEDANSLGALESTGANAIETSIEYGINPKTNTIYTDPNYTDSLTALGATIKAAASKGLSVMVRPLIDFLNPSDLSGTPYSVGDWRTYYNPGPAGSAGANAFFASYKTMILQQAQVAAANGATSLCIGTEIDQLCGPSYKSYWDGIISALRAQYPKLQLTYAADWDSDQSPWQWGGSGLPKGTGNLATQISFASELDSFGVDCYAPISDAANPTLAQLIAGWTQAPTDAETKAVTGGQSLISYFEGVAAQVGKPLIFTELGYANASDAASSPAGSSTNIVNPALQQKLYEAFFDAWQQAGNSSLTGVYFWNWDPNAAEVGPNTGVNFSPQEMPALAVVDDFFGSGDVVSFNAPSINAQGVGTLSGTAKGGAALAAVEIFQGSTALGAATINAATGAWSFSQTAPAGTYTLTAQATDIYGRVTSSSITLTVATGIKNEPYTAYVRVPAANGSSATTYYSNGTTEVDSYSAGGGLQVADVTTSAGVQTVQGHASGLTLAAPAGSATITGGAGGETFSFLSAFGHDTVTDFTNYLTSATPDKLLLPTAPFHGAFATLLADTSFGATGATITVNSSESVFVTGLTKAAMSAHSGDFTFG